MNIKTTLTNILIKRGYSPITTSNSIIFYNADFRVKISYSNATLELFVTNTTSTLLSKDVSDFNLNRLRVALLNESTNTNNSSHLNATYINLAAIIEDFLLSYAIFH